ncbi:molybdopterin-binding protein [Pedobacter lusitanus]|uniref:Molybdopterin molybdenumtransferase n=1 Tax=Pedobacter lusitanus TaxID=1503925 RepID=A0A0D0GVW0_9SPHI|nr:gephyrin-like molybdotransferase Glp [Pedobacter lusitanus]KIO78601.1 molybdopterin-binding protein [Pedobacter lusitanus]
MIAVSKARLLIQENIKMMPVQVVSLAEAAGYTLAMDIYAKMDIPAFEQSSMDGYAIRYEDRNLNLIPVGEMQAGGQTQYSLLPGQAIRIFTGAPLPENADTVVMQEKVELADGILKILDKQLISGMNVRPKGAETKTGELAIQKGCRLTPAAIGFLAGIGETEVPVYGIPSVGVVITGKELLQPGKELAFGQVYESNSYALTAALRQAQITKIKLYTADDQLDEVRLVMEQALQNNDVVLLTGGVSVGDYDFVVKAAELNKVTQVFHKIKQKPGKPLYFGLKGQQAVFGLPGNPSSVLSCFYQYVLPALQKMYAHVGVEKTQPGGLQIREAVLTHEYKKAAGLTHFLKAYFENGNVTPLNAQESFRMSSFAQANCMIELAEEETGFPAGTKVKIHILPE